MKKPEPPPSGSKFKHGDTDGLIHILRDQDLMNRINDIEKDYPYWEQFKYKVKRLDVNPVLAWKYLKIQRERNISHITLSDVNGFSFKYNISGNILKQLHLFDMNLGGTLGGDSLIPEKEKNRFLISSLMEEAIASSQLEGAVTTREVAKTMLRTKRKPKDSSERMIFNNYATIKEIVALKDEKLTPDIIKYIHGLMTKNTLEEKANEGTFRTTDDVKIVDINGEIFYDPPKHTELPKLIDAFCKFANVSDEKNFVHPIIKGIILHFLIGYIHPFVDGNGRTARAIFYWYLISKGYWAVEFLSISRIIKQSPSQYAKAYLYTEYDENDLTYFINFNLESVKRALTSLEKYIKRKVAEKKNLFKIIKHENLNERQVEVVKSIIDEPDIILSINEIQSTFGVAYQTARTDLLELETTGYIYSKLSGKKLLFFKSDTFDEKIKKIYS